MPSIALHYEIIEGVCSDPFTLLQTIRKEKPLMVGLLLDRKRFEQTREVIHHETVFIDDIIHDWSFREDSKTLVYYSHAMRSKRMCEYEGDEPERGDILLVYKYER